MNVNQLEENWQTIKADVKKQWGKLTNEELKAISGKKKKLIKKICEHYGHSIKEATDDLAAFLEGCSCNSATQKKNTKLKSASRPNM